MSLFGATIDSHPWMSFVPSVDVCQGEVRGHVLDLDELHSSIPFASTSDALFTSLLLKHKKNALMTVFDEVLALFRHPEFRSDRVTLWKSDDIYVHIADQRQIIAQNRNRRRTRGQTSSKLHSATQSQIPRLVVELVAEYLDSNRAPFRHTLHTPEGFITRTVGCDVSHILAKMSLVHRSWADVAQPFLRRRIHFHHQNTFQPVLLNPQLGRWVRELSIQGDGLPIPADTMDLNWEETPHEASRLLCRVLERCPYITHLHLARLYFDMRRDKASFDIIGQLANLKSLEHLWLHQAPEMTSGSRALRKLCAILPDLRSLKSLGLKGWGGMGNPGSDAEYLKEQQEFGTNIRDLTYAPSPPVTLTALSLVDVDLDTLGLWEWLLNPHSENRIVSLELPMDRISLEDSDEDSDIEERTNIEDLLWDAMTTEVTALQLLRCVGDSDLDFINECFPSLQTLSLCFHSAESILRNPIRLPESVRNVYFHFGTSFVENQDSQALAMLRAHPHVRRLSFTYLQDRYRTDTGHPSQLLLKETRKYATEHDVQLTVSEVQIPPHLLDL